MLTLGLHLLVRFHVLPKSQLSHPGDGLQMAIVLYLTVYLYAVLKLRYRQAVLAPLGWVCPKLLQGVGSLGIGVTLGITAALYQRSQLPTVGTAPSLPLVLLACLLAPTLEESLFRGCLFPLLASALGNAAAIAVTAGVFALFHRPTDLVQWVSFGLTGITYGLIRIITGTTTGPAIAHSAYNLILLSAAQTATHSR